MTAAPLSPTALNATILRECGRRDLGATLTDIMTAAPANAADQIRQAVHDLEADGRLSARVTRWAVWYQPRPEDCP